MVDLPARQAVRLALHRNILLTSQGGVTQPAAEVLYVPEAVLCTSVLCRKYQLITGRTARDFHQLGIVSATVQLALAVVVQQVLQHLPTLVAGEAGWMPALLMTSSLCKYGNISWKHGLTTT